MTFERMTNHEQPTQLTETDKVSVFISYRHEDSEGHTGRLYDAFEQHFGAEQVFMDIDAIPLGVDFRDVINQRVSSCDVLIAVIGRQWLTIADSKGPRLENPEDYVRLEIKAALERNVRVIPALVQGVEVMPGAHELPPDLAALSTRHGIQLRSESWRPSVARLIEAVDQIGREKAEREQLARKAQRQSNRDPVKEIAEPARQEEAERKKRDAAEKRKAKQREAAKLEAPKHVVAGRGIGHRPSRSARKLRDQLSAQEYLERGYARTADDTKGKIVDYSEALRLNPNTLKRSTIGASPVVPRVIWRGRSATLTRRCASTPRSLTLRQPG
jgi:hypothetical protein